MTVKQSGRSRLTFRTILTMFILIIVAAMTLLLVVVIESNNRFTAALDDDLNLLVDLQTMVEEMDTATAAISNYGVSGLEDYQNTYTVLSAELDQSFGIPNSYEKGSDGYYLYFDLINMYRSYIEQADRVAETYESGRESVYVNDEINDLRKNNIFVKEQLNRIIAFELTAIDEKYGSIEEAIKRREEMIYVVVFLVIIITLGLGALIANRLAEPIHRLSLALSRIGKGEFDMPPLEAGGTGEVANILVDFNKMQSRLSENIGLMQENSRIKDQLKNQEIELLETENHLKQSKLDFLQSQINPHFLYNTLNSIQTLADIEEAPQTEKMLEHLSSLMRYNVKKVNTVVLLSEEVGVIRDYVYIQMIRFGQRIQFVEDCDSEALKVHVPSMILQPLVENAMIHGLEPKMGQGTLILSAKVIEDHVILKVRDDGLGMEQAIIDRMMAYAGTEEITVESGSRIGQDAVEDHIAKDAEGIKDKNAEDVKKNARSIGVANVIRRCHLYYGHNVVSISSVIGEYTEFEFRLPLE